MAYGNGNLAYQLDGLAEQALPRPSRRPSIEVRPGGAQQAAPTPSLLTTIAKAMAVFILVAAVLSFARIMLTNEAVTTMIQNDSLSSEISDARAMGTSLEMEQSVLSNPSAVKVQAKKLGMNAPASMTTLGLAPDVVAIHNGTNLSLSDTIKNVVEVQE